MRIFFAICALISFSFAAKTHYDLYKLETNQSAPVLLIIGGIHGNEPGSYFAPSLFISHYKITKGAVWVVPNLNRDSIIKFERGIYGDMNRKFSVIAPNDPDLTVINDIKKVITDKRVAIVLNLHDGHGFYRPKFINDKMNPSAWGQATIIDQKKLDGVKYGELAEIASKVTTKTSVITTNEIHEFNVKNTETKEKDEQMRQSLTFFAINNSKPAFGVETSKNIDSLSTKTTYQLKAFEEFMIIAGIEFKRDFELNQQTVEKLIAERGTLKLSDKFEIPLNDIRAKIEHIPYDGKFQYSSNNPNVTLLKDGNVIGVYNGFKKITILTLDNTPYDSSLKESVAVVDAKETKAQLGSLISVQKDILFKANSGYRLNMIGFNGSNIDESDIKVSLKDFDKKYSLDSAGKIYRAEFYKDKAFCGAIIIKFQ
ncbi:MAG: hypothetical protein RL154_1670 [Pseudomonadota bacterium]|jgi:hypothetical protein